MTDLSPPDLDALPTQPPPPTPTGPTVDLERRRSAPRVHRTGGGRLWRLLALVLASQAALVSSAVLVAVERPSVAWSVAAVGLTDVFMVVCFSMMLGMVGRSR